MNTDNNKKVVLRFNKELLEKGNTEVLKEIISYDFINHTAPANMPHDINGMIQLVKVLHQGFPDLKVEIHEQIGENDLVSSRKTLHGTHLGEIMGHPATGKKVTMSVMDIVRVKNGKYTDHWGLNDIMQVIAEL
ncbi:ester cyclase [Prolixibacter denitrificans]|uniref:Putative ester cyclase n=1 Tax=Prolixibacter denitrificans TaxID=1541063 RepID=A0A2P8C8H1_9BACT|nr:ester cyclase [Prolixibacter denitrificans]PSK81257.1 putative ester cyclase [Prolixibacter denitrificans]GET21659.1 hypothetical protein JCM18694_19050 [Prolixibacter denitrificans]